jgi:hypothetical protein
MNTTTHPASPSLSPAPTLRLFTLLPTLTIPTTLLYLLILYINYLVLLSIYRLYIHPLARAHIPGPRLAALSYWYEHYYDVAPHSGQFLFHIRDVLHQRHGPIVRINPNEVSICDPEFYGSIYHSDPNRRTDRDKWNNLAHLGQGLAFTIEHDVHRSRRGSMEEYFSMRSVEKLEGRIGGVVEGLVKRLQSDVREGKTGRREVAGVQKKGCGFGEKEMTGWTMKTLKRSPEKEKVMQEQLPPGVENMYHLGSAVAFDVMTDYAFGT